MINKKIDSILQKYPKIKKLYLFFIKSIFTEDENKLKKIYAYNTATFLLSLYLYDTLKHSMPDTYLASSITQYSLYNILPTLYNKKDNFRSYIKKFIPYT